jgi:hypothetical protein
VLDIEKVSFGTKGTEKGKLYVTVILATFPGTLHVSAVPHAAPALVSQVEFTVMLLLTA